MPDIDIARFICITTEEIFLLASIIEKSLLIEIHIRIEARKGNPLFFYYWDRHISDDDGTDERGYPSFIISLIVELFILRSDRLGTSSCWYDEYTHTSRAEISLDIIGISAYLASEFTIGILIYDYRYDISIVSDGSVCTIEK
jgi:hypothetical protein